MPIPSPIKGEGQKELALTATKTEKGKTSQVSETCEVCEE